MAHKAGFVNIIGNPNVGKSTLMNALVGTELSIITSKAQTTRHRILGIVNQDDFQLVFSDTPGVLKPAYKMQENMMNFVQSAMQDADIFLFVTDIYDKEFNDVSILEKLNKVEAPVIILINKIDQLKHKDDLNTLIDFWHEKLPKSEILPISALQEINTTTLLNKLVTLLPEAPAFYPKDTLTDKPEKFFVSEIIREKIFTNYKKEVPYATEVVVSEFKEEEKLIRIRAEIMVERDSQKGILIGHKGSKLKKVGIEARMDIERFFGKQVFLETFVKVNKDWRSNDNQLKRFGYQS